MPVPCLLRYCSTAALIVTIGAPGPGPGPGPDHDHDHETGDRYEDSNVDRPAAPQPARPPVANRRRPVPRDQG
ncbi:hypothetical protein ABIA38_007303 [Embleya sp. AB8]